MRQFTSLCGQNLRGQLGFHDSNKVETDVNCGRGQPDHPQITFSAFKVQKEQVINTREH